MKLKEKYNREDFVKFLKGFIPGYEKDIRSAGSGGSITKNAFYLGESLDLDLAVFELTHTSLRDARVALSADGFKLMKDKASYRALIVYQAEKSDDWRLSLMTIDPDLNEEGKVIEKGSNPRRLSFLLGPSAKVRTPKKFLLQKGKVKDFDDLLSCFDVEVVEKEFFDNYKKLYEKLKGYLEKDYAFINFAAKNNIDINAFAKKLLGQIVFCYFLQRKGWLGAKKGSRVSDGDMDFMRSMFNKFSTEGKNYFNDCLEYLFYSALNKPTKAVASFYRDYFDCQIPFLNGGLFEPLEDYDWEKEFLVINNDMFSNKEGNGILDIFDLYNFTVYEDDPMDREVAVDPEMLGKVFENLLDENLRKGQGSFYTPREIVHYMCQESLTNYLLSQSDLKETDIRALIRKEEINFEDKDKIVIDDLLSSIKVCDPACGSGAFLVGMLNEIISIRRQLSIQSSECSLKKEAIENSIYGVDIDLGAVEIAKLRLWLSLVVDYELEDIEPLPNLDYKIMCGNSLLEELVVGTETIPLIDPDLVNKEKQDKGWSDKERKKIESDIKQKEKECLSLHAQGILTPEKRKLLDNEILNLHKLLKPKQTKISASKNISQLRLLKEEANNHFKVLRELHRKYFREADPLEKKKIRKQIDEIEFSFIQHSIDKKIEEIDIKIKNLNMQKPEHRKKNTELMKKKLEYAMIPKDIKKTKLRPYFLWHLNFFEVFRDKGGFDVVIGNPPYLQLQNDSGKLANIYINKGFETFERTGDIYSLFYERGIKLLKKDGNLCFITSNKWMRAAYGKSLRNFFIRKKPIKLIDLGSGIFSSATVDTNILLVQNSNNNAKGLMALTLNNSDKLMNLRQDDFIILKSLSADSWVILSDIEQRIKEKIEHIGTPLKNLDIKIYRGILTGYNEAFVIDGLKRKELIDKDPKSSEIIRPVLRGRDIKRYKSEFADLWLIVSHNGYKKSNGELVPRININDYPAVKNHLNEIELKRVSGEFGEKAKKAKGLFNRDDQGFTPYNLRNCAYMEEFFQQKIIYQEMVQESNFLLDEKNNYFCLDTGRIIVGKDIKTLLPILNSKLFFFSVKCFYGGGALGKKGIRMKHTFFDNFPVPKIDLLVKENLERCVDLILDNKLHQEDDAVDQIIYKLYNLDENEISFIENAI